MNSRTEVTDNLGFLNEKFESVQSLRGIAALFVLMQHICFIERGSFGVDLFFLISGFMMMYSTERSTEHFLKKRAIRIIPLYAFMTIISYAVLLVMPGLFEQTTASPVYLIKSLLFIPFSMGGVTQPLLRVGWTVNYEVLFYLLFFLSMKISVKYRALICSALLGVLVLIGIRVPVGVEPLSFWTDSILLEFVAGMALFYALRFLYEKHEAGTYTGKKNLLQAGIMLGICGLLFAYEWWSYESPVLGALPRVVRWGIPSVCILILTFVAGLRIHMPKILVSLGNMSYSVYLLHYYPMRFLGRMLSGTKHPDAWQVLITIFAVALTLLCAYVCYLLVEKKLTAYLKKKC